MSEAVDWPSFRASFSEFEGYATPWATSYAKLDIPLSGLAATASEDAGKSKTDAETTMATVTRVVLAGGAAAGAMLVMLGGAIVRNVIGSLDSMRTTIMHIAKSCDFNIRVSTAGNDELADTARALNTLLERVHVSLQEVLTSTESISASSRRASEVSSSVAEASSRQSEASTAMALAVGVMMQNISRISNDAGEALAHSREANSAAADGAEVILRSTEEIEHLSREIEEAGETVTALARESERISGIVDVIKQLADQTNLLALNAAIEAARAGEQGRGFAVVADEVRKLAESTTGSAQEISSMVSSMQTSIRASVANMSSVVTRAEAGRALSEEGTRHMERIAEQTVRAMEVIEGVSAAMIHQDHAASDISYRVDTLSQMSEANCTAGALSATVSQALDNAVLQLRLAVQSFKI